MDVGAAIITLPGTVSDGAQFIINLRLLRPLVLILHYNPVFAEVGFRLVMTLSAMPSVFIVDV